MKSLVIVALHYRTPEQQGGLRTWHMANALSDKFAVTVVTFAIDTLTGVRHPSSRWYKLWSKSIDSGFTVYRVNSFPCNRKSKIGRLMYYLSASFLQFWCLLSVIVQRDIVVTTSHPITSFLPSVLLAKVFRKKIVADVRDLPFDVAEDTGYLRSIGLLRLMKWLEIWALDSCNLIVCVSKGMLKRITKRSKNDLNSEYLPIGYDFLDNGAISHELSLALANKPKMRVCLTGTLGHLIDVDLLLSVAEVFSDDDRVDFIVAGDGQRYEEYLRVVEEKELNVIMLGRIPKSQVYFVCNNSDICLYPLSGGLATATMQGNKIFDYLGAGKATIYTGAEGDVSCLISEEAVGYVLPRGDVEGVCKILRRALNDSETVKLNIMSERAKKVVAEKYDVRKIMESFADSLEEQF